MTARIFHFGGEIEHGTVVELRDGGRLIEVASPHGERFTFALSPATAQFVASGRDDHAWMELVADADRS